MIAGIEEAVDRAEGRLGLLNLGQMSRLCGYEIDIGIVDFTDDNAKVDAALTLMKLVLPQL